MHIARLVTHVTLVLAATVCAAQTSELEERATVRTQAKSAYLAGDLESLERQHTMYGDFLRQRTSSGAFRMTLFFDGIGEAMQRSTEAEFLHDIERTLVWAKRHNTPLSHVLHVVALMAYSDYFRGSGYANTVPPQAWKFHEEYVRKASVYLLESEAAANKSTSWHRWALTIARFAGWPNDVVHRIFEAGVARDSADFTLYGPTLEYLLPKWHGSTEAVDSFIRHVVTRAPPGYGPELYARLYSRAGEAQFGRRLYADSLVDWTKMKEGLELWYQRFPTSWNKNIVAYNACIAGDKPMAKRLLDEIAGDPAWQIWQPGAKATFETCIRWAADPKAEPTAPRKAPTGPGKRADQSESQHAA